MMAKKQKLTTQSGDRIAIVAGLRTPFAKMATNFHGKNSTLALLNSLFMVR